MQKALSLSEEEKLNLLNSTYQQYFHDLSQVTELNHVPNALFATLAENVG